MCIHIVIECTLYMFPHCYTDECPYPICTYVYTLVYIYMACTIALIGRQGYIGTTHTEHGRWSTPTPSPIEQPPRLAVLRGKQASCSPLPWGHIPPPKMRMCVHLLVCSSKLVCVGAHAAAWYVMDNTVRE